jgi:hypothetical protein
MIVQHMIRAAANAIVQANYACAEACMLGWICGACAVTDTIVPSIACVCVHTSSTVQQGKDGVLVFKRDTSEGRRLVSTFSQRLLTLVCTLF